MSGRKPDQRRSVAQRVANQAKERRLARADAFTAYAMDRLLFRLGRSSQRGEFVLKGGVLVANMVDAPHRFTRDIDVLRRRGPPDPGDLRRRFREIVSLGFDDGVAFDPRGVRASKADHDVDGYDGVKVQIRAEVVKHEVDLRVDIGFGDAVVPPATRVLLAPFLDGDKPARVLAYPAEPVVAEKVETLLSKFPAIRHRLKDLLDVVVLAGALEFDGLRLAGAIRATLERRGTSGDPRVVDDMREVLTGRSWQRDWAVMVRDKAVSRAPALAEALQRLDQFVRPLLVAPRPGPPRRWRPGGPWR